MSWSIVRSKELLTCKIFTVQERWTLLPHTGECHPFYVLEARDWVITVPLTSDGQVILVHQFRHGIREHTLEIPAGIIEAGEAPEETALRELLEETGHRPGQIEKLGCIHSNPAFVHNRCHVFVGRDVARVCEPHPDDTESIETRLVPLSAIPRMISDGEITHAMTIAGFHLLGLRESR